MYKIEKGVLTKDGKKVFCIGQSYYPSFHKSKYPVPPDGDRIGEMKKDLKMMSEMGFNHVRYAAIGDVKLQDENTLLIDTPFVDAMVDEADKNDLSVSLRLEGYVVNLHGYENILMINSEGNEQDPNAWFDFIQVTLHHEGIKADNAFHAKEMAKYYKKFKNVVGYQIYNEPHYPADSFYDYHECTIKAYRKWLVENGIMTENEASTYNPPRSRKEQSPRMWALWRLFTQDSLTDFLSDASISARESSGLSTYTCYTVSPVSKRIALPAVDYFRGAKNMDVSGYTTYINAEGSNYYDMSLVCDMNYSAARLVGNTTWCVELDSRTKIPHRIFNKNTYTVLGSGAKGILYYQWRGDYPSESTPTPNTCGLVNYDGSKAPNYENAAKMVKFINRMSDYLVAAEQVDYGIGILRSDYAIYYCDGRQNDQQCGAEIIYNACVTDIARIYRDVKKAGFSTYIVPPEALEENRLNIKILLVPQASALSERDKEYVDAFIEKGGAVYEFAETNVEMGYNQYGKEWYRLYDPFLEFEDIAIMHNIKPLVKADNGNAALQLLEGDGFKLLSITNKSCIEKNISITIQCDFDFSTAVLCSSLTEDRELTKKGNQVFVDGITDGAMIIFK